MNYKEIYRWVKSLYVKKTMKEQIVEVLDSLCFSLRSGSSLLQAFGFIADEFPPPVSTEFGLILKEIRMGVPLSDAIRAFSERNPISDIQYFSTSLLVAIKTGGNLSKVLERLAKTIRQKQIAREQIRTLTLQGKVQGLILGLMPGFVAAAIYWIDPGFFHIFIKTTLGHILLITMVGLEVIGGFWIYSIVKESGE